MHAAERRDELHGEAVAEVVLGAIGAEILKWKDRDDRATGRRNNLALSTEVPGDSDGNHDEKGDEGD